MNDRRKPGIFISYSGNLAYKILTNEDKIITAAAQNVHFEREKGYQPMMTNAKTQTDNLPPKTPSSPPTKRKRQRTISRAINSNQDQPTLQRTNKNHSTSVQINPPLTQPTRNILARMPNLSVNNQVPGYPELRYPLRTRVSLKEDQIFMLYSSLTLTANAKAATNNTKPKTLTKARRDYFWDK